MSSVPEPSILFSVLYDCVTGNSDICDQHVNKIQMKTKIKIK